MGQMGFFDVPERYASLDAKAGPLLKLGASKILPESAAF